MDRTRTDHNRTLTEPAETELQGWGGQPENLDICEPGSLESGRAVFMVNTGCD
jgi:hypothetical protein